MLIIITIYNPLFQRVFYSMKHFDSFLNFVATLRIKLYHSINRIILKEYCAIFGTNVQILGKVSWLIRGQSFNRQQLLFLLRKWGESYCQ